MDIFVERTEGDYVLCRLPDKQGNLIRLPIKALPEGVKDFCVITVKSNGTMFINDYAKELRMERIAKSLKCKKYSYFPK